MKLSELRPCDSCDGPLIKPGFATFYVVEVSQALLVPHAGNQVLGLTQMFRGSVALAEVFAPEPDVVNVMGDEDPELSTELLLCPECAGLDPRRGGVLLAQLCERRNDQAEKEKREVSALAALGRPPETEALVAEARELVTGAHPPRHRGRKKTPEQEVRDLERAIRPRVRMWRVKHWIGDYLMELLAGFAVATVCIYAAVAWWVW